MTEKAPETAIVSLASHNIPSITAALQESSFSLDQYKNTLIASPDYLIRFWNTIILVIPVVLGQMFFAVMTSYGLSQGKGTVFSWILFLYLILMMLPYQVTVVPNYEAIRALHLLGTRFSIWLPGIFSPFSVYLLTKYMKRIPKEMLEAAEMDGAGRWKRLWRIVIPVCKGELTALAILVIIDYWNQAELPLVMFQDAFQYPLSVFLSQIREKFVGVVFAASVLYIIPLYLLVLYGMEDLQAGLGECRM